MGFMDKLKSKIGQAKDAVVPQQQQQQAQPEPQYEEQPQHYHQQAAAPQQPQYTGPTFTTYDGDTLPLPPGWDGLWARTTCGTVDDTPGRIGGAS